MRFALGGQAERRVAEQLVGREAVVQLDQVDVVVGTDTGPLAHLPRDGAATVPLLFIVLAIAVSVCFVLSKWWANAHVVGVGLMLSVTPTLLIGLPLVSGRQ